ncbi:MAG TPA: LytTR family DNA-binding domain-containing protein [Hanamia sp.]|nr:LytTR family DNA-binding domain-containing protein [Hanamia sp.]
MTHAIIIDDEQHCIESLSNLLREEFSDKIDLNGTATTVEEGIKLVGNEGPDLVFLDVQIGDKTAFDLLRKLNKINFQIIFTTAFEKYAIQAIKFSALDYLLKPIGKDDLELAINKLSEISKKLTSSKLEALLFNLERKNDRFKKIIVPTNTGFEFLDVADIMRCESHINYTTLYLKENKKLLVAKTLKEFEEMLSEYHFFRVHNSHLVNLAFVKSYHKGKGGSVMLADGTEIEVSTRRKDDFLKQLAK